MLLLLRSTRWKAQERAWWPSGHWMAHVTDAHCPHLGAHLGVGGRVTGSCIQCPFHQVRRHGWYLPKSTLLYHRYSRDALRCRSAKMDVMLQVPQAWSGLLNVVFVTCVLLCTLLFLSRYFITPKYKTQWHGRSHVPLRRPRKEMPPVFPNGWIPVLVSSELAPGEAKALDVIGESLVAFRTSDGTAHVGDAHCPHLGAHLGVGGRVTGNCIECPFHGWKFDATDGTCREVPYSTTVPQLARLKLWRTKELLGTLFIWYHADGEEPSWDIEDIPKIAREEWIVRDRVMYVVRCHVQDVMENAADVTHFNSVHSPGAVFPNENYTTYTMDTWCGKVLYHLWNFSWACEGPGAFLNGWCKTYVLGWLVGYFQLKITTYLNGPAFVVVWLESRFFTGVLLQMVTPEAPLSVRINSRLFSDPQTSRLAVWIASYVIRKMFDRDVSIWNNRLYRKNPVLVKEDNAIAGFRRWFSQFYSRSSPTLDDARDRTLEW